MAEAAAPDRARTRRRLALALAAALLLGREAGADEAVASLRIAASPARTYAVLTDLAAWSAIFPDVVKVSLEPSEDGPLRIHQVVRVLGMELQHTSAVRLAPDRLRLELELDPSRPADVAALGAVWTVTPDADGGSIVALRSWIETSQPVPAILRRMILQRTLRASVEALAAEVARRMGPIASTDDT